MKPLSIDEMELWPNLAWRMSALLKAGCSPATVFERLRAEQAPIEAPSDPLERLLTASDRAALTAAREDLDTVLSCCARSARGGRPVFSALETVGSSLAREYSRARVAELAACWMISERTGAGLAETLERLARFYESEIDLTQARDSAMSGPKSTGHILSWLPLLGLGLGMLMGTDPLGVLFGSVPGVVAAVLGLGLALVGRRWTARLVTSAERGEL
ncbi:type II secretion system F family protein [Rothia aerolata]|uniref:Type II secretion system protein GspF domain-containing protein n=1 Tax=Rothia aerolata TaxID=1812262 RepID=A0A917ISA8_9MICC|nr:type II secretion system F family protein [Rothia aerolata]GGH61181.1 hypothetical protein GCM10007359_10120 [Rothia aerolata]